MIDDIRFATRRLARGPALVLAVVGTIGLGVSATTAIYSALRAVILRPFPYSEPDRLVLVTENNPELGIDNFSVSAPTWADWRAQAKGVRDLAAQVAAPVVMSGGDQPERLNGLSVSTRW